MTSRGLSLLGILSFSMALWAQTPPSVPSGSASLSPVPKEYTKDEIPGWALTLRRAEILAIGAFPVTSLMTGLGFDYAYYFSNGTPAANVPWPIGPGTSAWTDTTNSTDLASKNLTILVTSAALAVAIAVGDWLLGFSVAAAEP